MMKESFEFFPVRLCVVWLLMTMNSAVIEIFGESRYKANSFSRIAKCSHRQISSLATNPYALVQ